METQITQEVLIHKADVSTGGVKAQTDFVAKETPLHIFLNRTHYITILCSPSQLKELVVGHLLSEGLLKSIDKIQDISIDKNMVCRVKLDSSVNAEALIGLSKPFARLVTSACGSPPSMTIPKLIDRIGLRKVPMDFRVEAKAVMNCVRQLNKFASVFRKTGGVHVAALFNIKGDLIALAEDVGRHNAVDKVIGSGTLRSANFNKCFLALSGRLTGDIILKAARVGIPLVASLAAAIDSGIEIADHTDITVIGFVRGNRMNVYANPNRVKI